MKTSKDALKKRNSLLSPDITLGPAQESFIDENVDFDLPVVIFPEWNEADIAAEKWATKAQFEDNDTIIYPRSLRGKFDHYKKPSELVVDGQSPIIMQSLLIQEEIFHGNFPLKGEAVGFFSGTECQNTLTASAEPLNEKQSSDVSMNDSERSEFNLINQESYLSQLNITDRDKICSTMDIDAVERSENLHHLEKTSKLFQANKHLLSSRLMLHLLSVFHFLYDMGKPTKQAPGEEFCLWDNIFPKGKDGYPMYNASGKYAVKLFWLGAWRKIIVDDRIPCSVDGKPLVISSPLISEIWPILITKAILKIAIYSYRETSEFPEQGDFDVLYALKGLLPEKLKISSDPTLLWNYLKTLQLKPTQHSNSISRSSSPNRDRQSSLNASMGGQKNSTVPKADLPVIIFSYRDPQNGENDHENPDIKTLAFYFRICEFKESDQSIDGESKYVRIKSYFTCGVQKRRKLNPLVGVKRTIEPEKEIDSWITFNEFVYLFSEVMVYHNSAGYRSIKSYQFINDPSKTNDTYRVPPLISTIVKCINYVGSLGDSEVLINISTFGRSNYQSTTLTVEPYSWTLSGVTPMIKASTNSVGTILLKMPNKDLAYRFSVDCSTSYHITFLSKDDFGFEDETKYLQDILGISVKDYEDSYTQQQQISSWTIIYKQILYFSDPTYISASLFLPESIQPYGCIKMIDNDDFSILPHVFYNVRSRNYLPNKSGYTIIAELKTPFARPQGKFKIRLISDIPILSTPEKPIEIWTKGIVQDFEEVYTTNKHNVLFRYVLKIKEGLYNPASLQVNFANLPIKFQLFDHDSLVYSASGTGIVTIPLYIFFPSDDPTVKAADKLKDDKANLAREKNRYSQGSNRPTNQKHRYVLLAFIDKPANFNASTSPNTQELHTRPPSRGLPKFDSLEKSFSSSRKTRKSGGPSSDDKNSLASITSEPMWKLRIISSDNSSMIVTKDTDKEDRYRAIKESWETAQPGRANRANEIRESYLKSVDNNFIQPIFMTPNPESRARCKPWMRLDVCQSTSEAERAQIPHEKIKIPHLDGEGWTRIRTERENRLKTALEYLSSVKSARKIENDRRISENKLKDILLELSAEVDALSAVDLGKRAEYRARVLLEIDEVAKALEAAKYAELAAAGITDDTDKKKKGKK